jgi:hypothetical protein
VSRMIVAHANPTHPLQVIRHMCVAAHMLTETMDQQRYATGSCGSLPRPAVYGNLSQVPGQETNRLGRFWRRLSPRG